MYSPSEQQKRMFQDILEYIETYSTTKPTEQFSEVLWREEIDELFEVIENDDKIHKIKDEVIEMILSFYKNAKDKGELKHVHKRQRRETQLQELLNTTQITQRTTEWYKQALELLTASQFGDLLAGGRTRAKLVMSKAMPPQEDPKRRLATLSQETNPFDWGIRFEPVAKMLYETITHTSVREIGRVVHKNPILKLAASPDGIIDRCENGARLGRLVEFKAPISRKIEDGVVPKNYWVQMQIQMEVADVDICDYFEIEIRSKNRSETTIEGPCLFYGTIQTIGAPTPMYDEPQPSRYIYSSVNSDSLNPMLIDNEQSLETLTWELIGFNLVTVHRSREWVISVVPEIEKFWKDVEAARQGEFELPPSKRKPKYEICMIQDDESSQPVPLSVNTEDQIMVEG